MGGGMIPESGPLTFGAATPSVVTTPEHDSP
jgi:hypothetical protein